MLRHNLAREESLYRDKEFSITIELATTRIPITATKPGALRLTRATRTLSRETSSIAKKNNNNKL